jgi:cytochrome c-type biogenesis protein CcmH
MPKRLLQLALVCVLCFTLLGAGSPATRFDSLGHKLVCQCGCGQILLECNHVGCPVSPVMIDELHAQIAAGLPDAGVLNFFIGKYGSISLAAPIRGGFDLVAWIVPFAVLLLGIAAVVFVLRLWRARQRSAALAGVPVSVPTPSPTLEDLALRDRIRRETTFDSQ